MLHLYTSKTELIINGKEIRSIKLYGDELKSEKPEDICENINWNTILKLTDESWTGYFEVKKRRKGFVLFIYDDWYNRIVYKQWKEDLNMQIVTEWKEVIPSIDKILKFHDGNNAIEYLVERGMNCIPIK